MPLQIKPSSGSGSITLQATTGTTTNDTLTLPAKTGNIITSADSGTVTGTMLASATVAGSNIAASTVAQSNLATGVAGNGPSFSAYYTGSGQSLTGATTTKIQINTEEWDTASCFDNTTNYRFTPNIAGYYLVTGQVQLNTAAYTNSVDIFKNGSPWKRGTLGTLQDPFTSCLVYLNGSTDYIEMYVYVATGTTTQSTQTYQTYFQAALMRAA